MPNDDDDDKVFGNPSQLGSSRGPVLRSKASKRDSFAAELERDPQLANAKRAHKTQTQVFTSSISHAALERQILTLKSSKIELETKLRDREGTVERLERDRRWFADREVAEKEEREKERNSWEEEKSKQVSDIRALRTSLASLTEAHAELEDTHSALVRSSSHVAVKQKAEMDTLTHRTMLLEDELSSARKSLGEREATLADLQARLEKLTQTNTDNEKQDEEGDPEDQESVGKKEKQGVVDTNKIIQDELHRQTSYLRQLESANANLTAQVNRLRERNTSVAVLQEEKRSLEGRLTQMEELRGKVGRLERELEEERLRSNSLRHDTPLSSSSETTAALASLRLAHAQLLSEHGATRAELAAAETRLEEARLLEERLAELEMVQMETEARAKRADEKRISEEREGTFLRALLASYTAESQASIDMSVDGGASLSEKYVEIRTHTEAQAKHIAHLETLLKEYKATNAKLSDELDAVGGDASALLATSGDVVGGKEVRKGKTREILIGEVEREREKVKEYENRLQSAKSDCVAHLSQIENLEQELFDLKGEVAGGRHVPPGVRVLQLRDNPESQWADMRREVVERLRKENEALLKRLKDVEARAKGDAETTVGAQRVGGENELHDGEKIEGGRAPRTEHEDLVPRESWDLLSKEKTDLEDAIKQKEKRLLRLKEVFNAKGAEFRDAIASILGVKLVFKPNGQVRVTSIYDLNASFVFQPTTSGGQSQGQGTMQLVAQGDGGPQDLPNLMHFWVEKEQCIPGFLASVTLECYENAKRNDVP